MTPTETADHNSLSEAVRAVTEHRREIEMRRMAHAAQQSQASSDWTVPVPRLQLEALEQQAREASQLRRLLESGPMIARSSSAQPLVAERHLPSQPKQRPRLAARPAPSA